MAHRKMKLFFGSFIEKSDADRKAKKLGKGTKVRPVKMRGRKRYQVYQEC